MYQLAQVWEYRSAKELESAYRLAQVWEYQLAKEVGSMCQHCCLEAAWQWLYSALLC